MSNDRSSANPARTLGDVELVAQRLAVAVKTVRRMVDAGRIPGVVRLGRLLRFDLLQVDNWIASGCPVARRPASGAAGR